MHNTGRNIQYSMQYIHYLASPLIVSFIATRYYSYNMFVKYLKKTNLETFFYEREPVDIEDVKDQFLNRWTYEQCNPGNCIS